MRYLGIDYGTKRIGLALSDEEGRVAFPHATLEAGPKALSEVAAIIAKERIQRVVIGESRNFKNEPNVVQEDIEQFKKDFEELCGLTVAYQPEFMTSAQATRSGGDDSSAAALILQSYLDRIKATPSKVKESPL